MPVLKLTVSLERDGKQLNGFPKVRRLQVDETQEFTYEEPDDAGPTTFSALPADQLATVNVLAVEGDQQITLRLDGQSDAGIVLNKGGLLLVFNGTIDAGAGASNAKVNNNSGATAVLTGIAGGT